MYCIIQRFPLVVMEFWNSWIYKNIFNFRPCMQIIVLITSFNWTYSCIFHISYYIFSLKTTGNQMNTTNMGGVIKSSDQTWLKKKQFISIIAGSSVLLVFTLVAITMVAIHCIRHKKRNTEPEFDSEFSSFQSNEYVADITDNITSVRYCQHDAFRENYQDEIYANSCR